MLQQRGMFCSVFNLNVFFELSDYLSYFRARPVCELYIVFKTKLETSFRCAVALFSIQENCIVFSQSFLILLLQCVILKWKSLYLCESRCSFFSLSGLRNTTCQVFLFPALAKVSLWLYSSLPHNIRLYPDQG